MICYLSKSSILKTTQSHFTPLLYYSEDGQFYFLYTSQCYVAVLVMSGMHIQFNLAFSVLFQVIHTTLHHHAKYLSMYISHSQKFVSHDILWLLGNLNFQWPVVTYASTEHIGSHTVSIQITLQKKPFFVFVDVQK